MKEILRKWESVQRRQSLDKLLVLKKILWEVKSLTFIVHRLRHSVQMMMKMIIKICKTKRKLKTKNRLLFKSKNQSLNQNQLDNWIFLSTITLMLLIQTQKSRLRVMKLVSFNLYSTLRSQESFSKKKKKMIKKKPVLQASKRAVTRLQMLSNVGLSWNFKRDSNKSSKWNKRKKLEKRLYSLIKIQLKQPFCWVNKKNSRKNLIS